MFFEYEGYPFVFSEPSSSTVFRHYKRRESEKIECEKDGFLTKEQEEQMLKENGLWVDGYEEKISDLKKDLEKLQKNKHELRFRSAEKRRVDRTVAAIKSEIERIEKSHNTFHDQTIDYQSELRCKYRLMQECLYRAEDGKLEWATWEDFENDSDIRRINELMVMCFHTSAPSEKQYRELARSEPWRSTWRVSCKTGTPIFNGAACDFTASQKHLTYWSAVYDNVFESIDCPSQSVIDDDDALDAWFEQQSIKAEKSRADRAKENGSFISNQKIANSREIFVPVDSKEDAEKVYNELNSSAAKATFRRRQNVIDKSGEVKETEMPDTVQEVKMAYTRMQASKIKDR